MHDFLPRSFFLVLWIPQLLGFLRLRYPGEGTNCNPRRARFDFPPSGAAVFIKTRFLSENAKPLVTGACSVGFWPHGVVQRYLRKARCSDGEVRCTVCGGSDGIYWKCWRYTAARLSLLA